MTARELGGRLGLKKGRRDWRGRCPACSYPGTFSVTEGRVGAIAWCASCQDKVALTDALNRVTDGSYQPAPEQTDLSADEQRARKQEAARRCWVGSSTVPSSLAEAYLWSRQIGFLSGSVVLRYRSDTSHPQGGRLPAMIALITDVDNQPIAVHRTYLDRATGRKADVDPPKASLGPMWGGAIRLATHKPDMPLVIGEGIETAASAGLMTGAPAWAAISAGNLAAGLHLPATVQDIIIAVDPDEPGERAAQTAGRRWRAEGRQVRMARTGRDCIDFNDVLMERKHG